ncbi:ABC transporter permease [Cellulomonas pakistanensis]|uniref:ABC transporter permease n=1 Tax=Cellulomonas pakistanensis TaxID=992287 RepID=A0A919PBV1_9CELL|nr:ABC transporter permease subunit [Cellulomonas pakistanensis]GIG36811.1 ABC transporter permease [Cellulomonas pakistanensis]
MSVAVARFRGALARPWVGGTVGIALLLALWWAMTAGLENSTSFPSPVDVARSAVADGWGFYEANVVPTLTRAAQGYLWGNLAGLALAAVVLVVPRLEDVITQLGVISACLPVTAIGPIVMVIFGGRASAIFLGALLVFFTTLVGAILGMRSASRSSLDLVAAYGGGRWTQIRKVQLMSALPAIVTALQVAVPAALLGAVVGEYLGGIDSGIGVALNAAQRQIQPDRVWALSILAGLIALGGYALVGLVGRVLTPWAKEKRG